jgi:type IV secretion system protein VirB6
MGGYASYLEDAVDQILANFVTAKSAALCGMLLPLALAGTTIYVLTMGYAVARGEAHDSFHSILWQWFKVSMISAVALGGGEYQAVVIDSINAIPGILTAVFNNATSVGALIDSIADPLIALVKMLQRKATMGTIPDLTLVLASLTVALSELIIVIIAAGTYLIAKVALGLVLAVGPIFVMCLMWPVTRSRFEGWFGQAINFAFLQGLLATAIGMFYTVVEQFSTNVVASANTNDVMVDALALLGVSTVIGILVWKGIPMISAGITGGSTVEGMGREIARGVSNLLDRGGKQPEKSPPKPPKPNTIDPADNSGNAGGNNGNNSNNGGGSGNSYNPASAPLAQRYVLDNIRKAAKR